MMESQGNRDAAAERDPQSNEATHSEPRVAGLQGEEGTLEDQVVKAIESCFDPEIPVNIYELGLIYRIDIEDQIVDVDMTLTSPACPVAGTLPGEVEGKIAAIESVEQCKVGVVWDPPWTKDRMTEGARLQLGMF
jgi:FeS assembly SUF system protein